MVTSPFMTEPQLRYVNRWLEGCQRVVPPKSRSTLAQTCICWKRQAPLKWPLPAADASTRPSLASRLYDADEVNFVHGHLKVKVGAHTNCLSSLKVPRVFTGRRR